MEKRLKLLKMQFDDFFYCAKLIYLFDCRFFSWTQDETLLNFLAYCEVERNFNSKYFYIFPKISNHFSVRFPNFLTDYVYVHTLHLWPTFWTLLQ